MYQNRHGRKWIVAFSDSHVESLPTGKLFDGSNPAVLRRWNIDGEPHN
jgi:hypothetical protein